jgi:bacterioferritin-associated ferredoxin
MIICSCNLLSDTQVRRVAAAAGQGPLTAGRVYGCLGCSAQCGRCARTKLRGCPCRRADYNDAGISIAPAG